MRNISSFDPFKGVIKKALDQLDQDEIWVKQALRASEHCDLADHIDHISRQHDRLVIWLKRAQKIHHFNHQSASILNQINRYFQDQGSKRLASKLQVRLCDYD